MLRPWTHSCSCQTPQKPEQSWLPDQYLCYNTREGRIVASAASELTGEWHRNSTTVCEIGMRKVLIVEPNAADARALRDALREAGLPNASTVLRDAVAAKRHLAERDRDAIMLLNIHASDGHGLEFLAWL